MGMGLFTLIHFLNLYVHAFKKFLTVSFFCNDCSSSSFLYNYFPVFLRANNNNNNNKKRLKE